MTTVQGIGTMVVRGVTLRASPAREACFRVVTDQIEVEKFEDGTIESRREQLHSGMNSEVQSLEIAAQCLVEFPNESWELRMQLARQCWDETRHAQLYHRRLLQLGGWKGQFPILNQEWAVVCTFDSLAARLVVQNQVFEGLSLDVMKESVATWTGWGDQRTAEIIEGVMVDEIRHAGFANEWLRRQKAENPAALLRVVAAMSRLKAMTAALTPPEHQMEHAIPVNSEDRRHAGLPV